MLIALNLEQFNIDSTSLRLINFLSFNKFITTSSSVVGSLNGFLFGRVTTKDAGPILNSDLKIRISTLLYALPTIASFFFVTISYFMHKISLNKITVGEKRWH